MTTKYFGRDQNGDLISILTSNLVIRHIRSSVWSPGSIRSSIRSREHKVVYLVVVDAFTLSRYLVYQGFKFCSHHHHIPLILRLATPLTFLGGLLIFVSLSSPENLWERNFRQHVFSLLFKKPLFHLVSLCLLLSQIFSYFHTKTNDTSK